MEKPKIRLLHNLARVGGTLVSRCLGCMEGIVLLSEIHPLGTKMFHPLKQADEWHHLFTPEDIRKINAQGAFQFADGIRMIHDKVAGRGGHLVVRDWAHLDYVGVPFLNRPTGRLLLADAVRDRFEPLSFCVVRHPVDQFLSLARLKLMQGALTLPLYLKSCADFAAEAVRIGFMRYEDFTREPEKEMQRLCAALELPCDPSFTERWADYAFVTGDTGGSRGNTQRRIQPMPRKEIPEGLMPAMRADPNYGKTLELLGYEDAPGEA
jgi:hypothetical protein